MKFGRLAEFWSRLEDVSSRLAMTEILAEMLGEVDVDEIREAVYLSLGQLGARYENQEFQMAEKLVVRAIAEAYGLENEAVWKKYKEVGDVGGVVEEVRSEKGEGRREKSLSVCDVYQRLMAIAKEGGAGSQERKVTGLAELLRLLPMVSAKYVVRIPVANLRLGFSDMTVLDALSWMVAGDKSLRVVLEEAFNVAADVGLIAKEVKSENGKMKAKELEERVLCIKEFLETISIKLGTPVVPALCQRLETFDEVIEKMGEVACEPKYDGTRLQIHWRRNVTNRNNRLPELFDYTQGEGPTERLEEVVSRGSSVLAGDPSPYVNRAQDDGFFQDGFLDDWTLRTFTRNLEENSAMFPELEKLGEHLWADEVILDGEAVGWDAEHNKWLPFQVTMTRKRKHGVADQLIKVPLRYMVFDILYVNLPVRTPPNPLFQKEGKTIRGDVHGWPLRERRRLLEAVIRPGGLLEATPIEVTSDPVELRERHFDYLKQGLEGVVIKKWDGAYVPGRKGWSWVKMKEVESAAAGLADTLDCVVMGYYLGKGKRVEFGLGAFLVGVIRKRSEDDGCPIIVTVSKIGTGLSDEQFRELYKRLGSLRSVERPESYEVSKLLEPDVWVKPEIVVEIAADNITKSPNHTAGLALRFPRLVKFRDDKSWEEASTVEEVVELYRMQG